MKYAECDGVMLPVLNAGDPPLLGGTAVTEWVAVSELVTFTLVFGATVSTAGLYAKFDIVMAAVAFEAVGLEGFVVVVAP